jgi:sulfatase modifying factor 1
VGSPSDEPERHDDEAQVEVTLSGFWIGKYEVTQEQWRKLMGTTVVQQRNNANPRWSLGGEGDLFPMHYVNHQESCAFCVKLTEQERRAGRLPAGWEYRLPTEAQWEYACRAETTTATAFGHSLSSRQANFNGAYTYAGAPLGPYLEKTCIVGSYPPNAWGLHDMHGNVWEWCLVSQGKPLPGGPAGKDNSAPADSGGVVRGGGWSNVGERCRSAARHVCSPSGWFSNVGFRVAAVPIEGAE